MYFLIWIHFVNVYQSMIEDINNKKITTSNYDWKLHSLVTNYIIIINYYQLSDHFIILLTFNSSYLDLEFQAILRYIKIRSLKILIIILILISMNYIVYYIFEEYCSVNSINQKIIVAIYL